MNIKITICEFFNSLFIFFALLIPTAVCNILATVLDLPDPVDPTIARCLPKKELPSTKTSISVLLLNCPTGKLRVPSFENIPLIFLCSPNILVL